ncbi:heavy metal-binding domain-containing protein [Ureaplasma ceti]|uniref:YbjQ family protein n=1 Tax=Ureaplasma ceti TaxID=3119530 RepID=A0ABP9U6H1_9BACT
MKLLTTMDFPGKEYEVIDLVFHSTVKARNVISKMGSAFKSTFGGSIGGVEKLYISLREEVIAGLKEAAAKAGADAVIGVRFDVSEMGAIEAVGMTAYGTMIKFK